MAQLVIMKIFGINGGAYDADYLAAIEDAIILGCDSVNLSLGSAYPGFRRSATYEALFASFADSDIVMTISAGNVDIGLRLPSMRLLATSMPMTSPCILAAHPVPILSH